MHRRPIYPTRPVPFPSPRSGLTRADALAARTPKPNSGDSGAAAAGSSSTLKSEAEEFRQAIRIDIGGLEMRAQEGKGSRFEAARKFCELQHSLVALTTISALDKLAALAEIDVAVNTLDARFPGVFAQAKDLVTSAREAISISAQIKRLKTDFEAADLENATLLLDGRSNVLAWQITEAPDGPFKDRLRDELYRCWLEVKITHPDKRVCELLGKHLMDYPPPVNQGAAASSASSSPSASDLASLRAAESTKITLPLLKMHVNPTGQAPCEAKSSSSSSQATEQAAATILSKPVMGVQGLGRTVELVENVVKLTVEIEKFLEELLPLHFADLGGRLLTGEVARLIDQIVLNRSPGEAGLLSKLGSGLNELRLTHKDPDMRAEMTRVLGYCFDPPRENLPIRAITGERRLRMRVAFVVAEGPKLAPGAAKCLEDFAFKLVDDIKRDIGDNSPLMLEFLDELDGLAGLNQLGEAIYRRSW